MAGAPSILHPPTLQTLLLEADLNYLMIFRIAPIQLQQIVPLLYSSMVIFQKSVNLWVTGNKEDKTLLENIKSMALRMIEGCRFGTALAHDIGTYSRQKPLPDTAW